VQAVILQLLADLHRTISGQGQELERLRENEHRLESLLEELRAQPAPDMTQEVIAFDELKGRLPWPARGSLASKFGTPRKSGALKWQGVIIAAAGGQDVTAISRGRVVYADWLRHFGLLLIIDHGNGYMSLYGHNQSLFKERGDWVEAGETIASVGDSGGHAETGLYFEIRRRGTPVNPVQWCRKD